MYNNADGLQMNNEIIPDKMNIFQRIGNLLFNPRKLFAFTARKPTILFPVIVLVILSIVPNLLLMEQYQGTFADTIYSAGNTAGGEITVDQAETMAKWLAVGTVASAPFTMIIRWILATLILYPVFRLAGCEKGMKKYFSMIAYITVIAVLGQIVHSLYIYYTGETLMSVQVTSLASLVGDESMGSFLYAVIASIEVFNIWTYILYGIGFAYTGGVKKQKAYLVSAVLFVAAALINAGAAHFTTQLAGLSGIAVK
mgnify:FL=1